MNEMRNIIYDVAVIGNGLAGMSAAFFAGSKSDKVLMISKGKLGGYVANLTVVEGLPSVRNWSGKDVISKLEKQIDELGCVDEAKSEAKLVRLSNRMYEIFLEDGRKALSKSVIIAAGASPRKVSRDASEFKGKAAVVVGSDELAASLALSLSERCDNVYVVSKAQSLSCSDKLSSKVEKSKKIQVLPSCSIAKAAMNADKSVKSVELSTSDVIACDGLFFADDYEPNTSSVQGVAALSQSGYVAKTTAPGLYAIGSCRADHESAAMAAEAEAYNAAISAVKYSKSLH